MRPVKQLKAFRKIHLCPGESTVVCFELPVTELGYYDWNMNYCIDDGTYRIFAGSSSETELEADIVIG